MNQQREGHWNRWGPYVTERACGTVREDYSKDGDAWSYFPHDQARSRAYLGMKTESPGSAIATNIFVSPLLSGHSQGVRRRLYSRIEGPSEVQLTSTNTSETSSEGGPLRHASTLSRIPSIISLKGRSAASRINFRRPGTPSISSRELKTSVIPSE